MTVLEFLVELLVKAGVSRALAVQLAQRYLAAHGIGFDPAKAVEQILEELARGGGGIAGTVGSSVALVSGGIAPSSSPLGDAGPVSSGDLASIFQQLADSSRGTVSAQALGSYGLTVTQAAAATAYQTAQQTGGTANIDAETYSTLESLGMLDSVNLSP